MNSKFLRVIFCFILIISAVLIIYKKFVITSSDSLEWERRVINCSENNCIVQDFFKSGEKLTDPFKIKRSSSQKANIDDLPEYFDYTQSVLPILGKVVVWYQTGDKYSEQNFDEQGRRQGKQIFWHVNGQKAKQENFHEGIWNGESISWYENGQKSIQLYGRNGKLIGTGINWYENGQKKYEYSLEPNRINKAWYKNGKRKSFIYYQDNLVIKTIEWDEQGNEIVE